LVRSACSHVVFSLLFTFSTCEMGGEWKRLLRLPSILWEAKLASTVVILPVLSGTCEKDGQWQQAGFFWAPNLVPLSYSAVIGACEKGEQLWSYQSLPSVTWEPKLGPTVISYNARVSKCEKGNAWISTCEKGERWQRAGFWLEQHAVPSACFHVSCCIGLACKPFIVLQSTGLPVYSVSGPSASSQLQCRNGSMAICLSLIVQSVSVSRSEASDVGGSSW